MYELLAYLARIAIIFSLVYWALRVSGKKTISAMTPADLMGTMLIAAMVAVPLVSQSALLTVYGVAMVVFLQVSFGLLGLWNPLRSLVQPHPLVLIAQGKVDRKAMVQSQFGLDMLLSELRIKGYQSIKDVEYAILEPSGTVSVIPTAAARLPTVRDMKLPQSPSGLALPLIMDGAVVPENLRYASVDQSWLYRQLEQKGYRTPSEIFLAELDAMGELTIQATSEPAGALYPKSPEQH